MPKKKLTEKQLDAVLKKIKEANSPEPKQPEGKPPSTSEAAALKGVDIQERNRQIHDHEPKMVNAPRDMLQEAAKDGAHGVDKFLPNQTGSPPPEKKKSKPFKITIGGNE